MHLMWAKWLIFMCFSIKTVARHITLMHFYMQGSGGRCMMIPDHKLFTWSSTHIKGTQGG